MRGLLLGVAAGLMLGGMADVRAATEPSTISPGGGKSPARSRVLTRYAYRSSW